MNEGVSMISIKKRPLRLGTFIILLVCLVLAISLAVTNWLVSQRVVRMTQEYFEGKAKDVSHFMSESIIVKDALSGRRLQTDVQQFAETIRRVSGVEFIVVVDMNGIRYTHPNPEMIGQRFVGGDDTPVYSGKEFSSVAEGTLGKSMRYFTPVFDADGRQIGAISVGILMNIIEHNLNATRLMVLIGVLAGFTIGIPGAFLLAGRIKKILFGLEPEEIARLFEEKNALVQSVREGILGVDKEMRITVVNQEAARLFAVAGITDAVIGKNVEEVVPNTNLHYVIETGLPEYDQEQELHGVRILTNRLPVTVKGEIVGAVATFRDKSEVTRLAEQLTGVKIYADALRSQTHEFMNRLHVILGLIHMGKYERVSDYIKEVSLQVQDEVGYVMSRIKDPVLAGFVMAKLSSAREKGIVLVLSEDTYVPEIGDVVSESDISTILGNLIENAMDAVGATGSVGTVSAVAQTSEKKITVHMAFEADVLSMVISDSGEGIDDALRELILEKGYSTRGEQRGLGMHLIARILEKYGGTLDIGRADIGGAKITVKIPVDMEVKRHD
jgi:CitB family two-component system sensor histidine kinase MalK